jgi:putative effector of murein hydrolase
MINVFMAIAYILLTIILFRLGIFISNKFKIAFLNPILITAIIIIIILKVFKIPYSDYYMGGSLIVSALGPIVVVLAIPLYKNRHDLMKNFIPIMVGVTASIITSVVSVTVLCKLFGIDKTIMLSLLSKSITAPMAVESTKLLGGNEAVTVLAVVLTGLIGAAVAPAVVKLGKIKSNIAKGIGIGSASHAVGTTKAVEMNEEAGAASGLAIGVTGLLTIIAIIIFA